MSASPDYERVADVYIRVALRLSEQDETQTEGEDDVDTGVLSRLDGRTG